MASIYSSLSFLQDNLPVRVARSSFEPDTESNEHQPDIFTVRLIAVYLDSPCHKDKNNGYRLELHPLTSSRGCCAPPCRAIIITERRCLLCG